LRHVRQHSKRRAAEISARDIPLHNGGFLQLKQPAAAWLRFTGNTQALFVAVSVALAGVPLLITPGLCLYFDITPKVVLLLCTTAAALLMIRAWLGGLQILWSARGGRLLLSLLALQLLSLLASTLFSSEPGLSFAGSNWRRFGLVAHGAATLFAVVFASFLSLHCGRLRALLRVFTTGGLLAAVYGILQYFGIDPLVAPEAYHIGEGEWTIVRTPGTLGHAGYFATYLLTVVFWALALAQREANRAWQRLALGAAGLGSFAIVLSGTRGAILGLLAGAALGALWRRPRLNRRFAAGALLAAFAFAAFYYSPPGEKLRGRTRWYVEDATGGGRLLLWRDSLRMFAAGPWWTGAGLETYSAAFPGFLSPELAKAYPNRYYESPHNIFVDALTSQGLPGALFLIGWTSGAIGAAWRLRKRQFPGGAWLASAFAAALCSNQFLAFTAPTALCFYLSATLLVIASVPESKAAVESRTPRWGWLAGACAAGVFVVFAVRLAAADASLLAVQRIAQSGEIAAAVSRYQRVLRLQPWGFTADLWFSRLMLAQSQKAGIPAESARALEEATQAGERAAEYAPERQAAWYNLAVLYGLQNDAPRAEAALRRTIAIAPVWYKPHWMLAQLLRETGSVEEALREAEVAHDLNGGANPEVAATRDQLRSMSSGTRE
jgi:O-antigen ligase